MQSYSKSVYLMVIINNQRESDPSKEFQQARFKDLENLIRLSIWGMNISLKVE